VPLPEDRGLDGEGRPKVRRFRSYQLDLGQRLAAFRERYGVTQAEVARAVGAVNASTVSLWESGVNVPDGILRERLADLLDGRRWPELRSAMTADAGDGLPGSWDRAARWYRRASRERRPRETTGALVAAVLGELRGLVAVAGLLGHYRDRDGDWVRAVLDPLDPGAESSADLRQVEDAAYGLRWLELAHGLRLRLDRSLVPQLSPELRR
jgi:transcriptional regulator with XRE-family HTH domain